jgi:hypothetical protein
MAQPAAENWERWSAKETDHTPPPPLESWPPPPPLDPTRSVTPQLRLVSPDQDPPEPAQATATSPPLRSLGLTRPSVTSDLDSELQAAREELHALHELLEELPAIFERKFQQRLKAALHDQRRLLGENQELRRSLAALLPGASIPVANPPPRLLLPPALERASSLGQTLRQVLRRGREDSSAEPGDATTTDGAEPLAPSPLPETDA